MLKFLHWHSLSVSHLKKISLVSILYIFIFSFFFLTKQLYAVWLKNRHLSFVEIYGLFLNLFSLLSFLIQYILCMLLFFVYVCIYECVPSPLYVRLVYQEIKIIIFKTLFCIENHRQLKLITKSHKAVFIICFQCMHNFK